METNQDKTEIKPGDLFYASWGYDQTNYDFVVVVKLSPTGKTAICRRASHIEVEKTSEFYNTQKPVNQPFGPEFKLKVELRDGACNLRGSYPFCSDANLENKRLGTLWPVKEGQTFDETDSRYGH